MSSNIKPNSKYLTLRDVLTLINKDVSLLDTSFRFKHGSPLDKIFNYAFNPKCKWLLPEGKPPFKESKFKPGTAPCDILRELIHGYLDYFLRTDIKKGKRQELYIRLLEYIDADDAEVLLHVKDNTLSTLFPNITLEEIQKHGYLEGVVPEVKTKVVRDPALGAPAKEAVVEVKVEETTAKPKSKRKYTRKTKAKATKNVSTEGSEASVGGN